MHGAVSSFSLGGLIVVGSAFGLWSAEPPPQTAASEATPDETAFNDEYGAFGDLLMKVMAGDTGAGDELIEAGMRMCRLHDRCDAESVARYYAGMTESELAAGRRARAHYEAARQEVLDARAELPGVDSEQERVRLWRALRAELDAELRLLVERVLGETDFAPAGYALSLLARLDVHQVELDADLTDESDIERLLENAERDAQRSLDVFERAGMLTPRLEPLWTLARIDRKRADMARARQSYDELLDLATHVRRDRYREHALKGLILVARELGDVAEIDQLLYEFAHIPALHDPWFVASKHARNLLYQDEPEAVISFLDRNRPSGVDELHEWNVLVAGARLRLDDMSGVRRSLDEVAGGEADRAITLAQVALHEERYDDVVTMLADGALAGSMEWNKRAVALCALAEARLALHDPRAAIEALEEALAAADTWRLRFESSRTDGDPVINVLGEVVGVHAVVLLARAHAELGDALAAARVIEDLQSRSLAGHRGAPAYKRAGKRGDKRAGAHGTAPGTAWSHSIREQDILAWAGAYELGLITWVVGADSSLVVHVGPDGDARAVPIEHGRHAVAGGVRRLREAFVAGDEQRAAALADEIRRTLIPDAIATRLAPPHTTGGPARLLCLLHGPLERLPIEALLATGPLRPGQQAPRVAPLVLPGLPATIPGAPLRPDDLTRWNLLGDPLGHGDGLSAELPGARAELDDLERLYADATLRSAAGFDRAAFTGALVGDRPLHVATHFVPGCEDRGRLAGVGLQLSGGDILCPQDVQAAEPGLPLVVLSACESQTGRFVDSQGLLGVARAFLESGTRNLLVTLWPVEDGAAREYALAFHHALVEGHLPSRAAAVAREGLRQRGFEYADWAAFRLVGRD